VRAALLVWAVGACTPLQSAAPRDAAPDAPPGDACGAQGCAPEPGPPRLIAPLSGETVRAQRPSLRWRLGASSDGARVTFCRDRAMTDRCASFNARGERGGPTDPLAPGVWFWRAAGRGGQATGRATSATWRLRVGLADSARGSTLDVDGDQSPELAVSAPRAAGYAGRVYLWEAPYENHVAAGAVIRRGSAGSEFGVSLAEAGDVNGDGYSDLVVGAQLANRASLFLGGAGGLAVAPTQRDGGDAHERFGEAVAGVGDVNGDGLDDVAVAARSAEGASARALVFHGDADGVAREASAALFPGADVALYLTVGAAGDVNGDGFADVVLGAPTVQGTAGAAYVFHGGPDGLPPAPSVTLPGVDLAGLFGNRLAAAGDVNGDGYGDLFVTAAGAAGRRGRVYVFHGGPGGLDAVAAVTLDGPAPGSGLGAAVARGADLDNDGFADLVVSASGFPVNLGSVRVHRGGPSGVAREPWLTRDGLDGADAGHGHMLLTGDYDRDGRADLVVTAVGASSNTGRAYLYLGAAGGFAERPIPITGPDGVQAVFGWALARARRVDGVGTF